jgi:tRNA pseudouridine38-40 synthase
MAQRFRALVAYDGAAFHGWQIQSAAHTVEGELTRALAQVHGRLGSTLPLKVQGASRTDAGVHAEGQVAHFDYHGDMDARRLARAINAVSDPAVRVLHLEPAPSDFHARHDARGKQYRYRLWAHSESHPLRRHQAMHVRHALDLDAMRAGAPQLLGTHDFTSLRASGCAAASPVVTLTRLEIQGTPPALELVVEGTAFLKYMVRNLVGTLLEVGRGRLDADAIPALLRAKDREQAGETAPPHGLRLMWVRYPEHPWRSGEAVLPGPGAVVERLTDQ